MNKLYMDMSCLFSHISMLCFIYFAQSLSTNASSLFSVAFDTYRSGCSSPEVYGDNLLVSADFESQWDQWITEGNSTVTNWSSSGGVQSGILTGNWMAQSDYSGLSQSVSVEGGQTYRCGGWFQREWDWTNPTVLKLEFFDASHVLLSRDIHSMTYLPSESWIEVYITADAPLNAAFAQWVLEATDVSRVATFYADDAVLQTVTGGDRSSVELTWTALPGRIYRVYTTTNLVTKPWTLLRDGIITETTCLHTLTLTNIRANIQGSMYRLGARYRYQGNEPGTLRAYINTSLTTRTTNTNLSIKLYNDGWPSYGSGGSWTRNTNCWIGNINLTCASPYNSQGNQVEKGGTAITRQHIAYANHYPITNGASVMFVDLTNGLHWRTLVDSRRILTTDCRIGLLDEPLPDSIMPAQLLRLSDNGRFKGVENMTGDIGLRTIHLKAAAQASPKIFCKWACFAYANIDGTGGIVNSPVSSIGRTVENCPFSVDAVLGDSGQPTFVIIGTNTVLYSTFYSTLSGPNIGYLAPGIEAAISEMGNSIHTNLNYVNLEEWPDYTVPPQ